MAGLAPARVLLGLLAVEVVDAGHGEGDGTLEYQVREGTVYAPIAGLVTEVSVHEGDIPQGKLLSIADDSSLVIRADVRESDVPNISVGDRVDFTSTATGKKQFKGKVTRIAPAASGSGSAEAVSYTHLRAHETS